MREEIAQNTSICRKDFHQQHSVINNNKTYVQTYSIHDYVYFKQNQTYLRVLPDCSKVWQRELDVIRQVWTIGGFHVGQSEIQQQVLMRKGHSQFIRRYWAQDYTHAQTARALIHTSSSNCAFQNLKKMLLHFHLLMVLLVMLAHMQSNVQSGRLLIQQLV